MAAGAPTAALVALVWSSLALAAAAATSHGSEAEHPCSALPMPPRGDGVFGL